MSNSRSTRRSLLKKLGVGATSIPIMSGVGSATSMKDPDEICDDDDDEKENKTYFYTGRGDDQPEEDPVEYKVKVISGRESTDEQPITIEISITNKLDSTISIADVEDSFFYGQMSKDQSFMLIPSDASEKYYTQVKDCWILDRGYFMQESFDMVPIEPGDTISRELYVLHTQKNVFKTCQDYPKTIRFPETECYVFYMIGGHGTTVNWGFNLKEVSIWGDPTWHPPRYDEILEGDSDTQPNSEEDKDSSTKKGTKS